MGWISRAAWERKVVGTKVADYGLLLLRIVAAQAWGCSLILACNTTGVASATFCRLYLGCRYIYYNNDSIGAGHPDEINCKMSFLITITICADNIRLHLHGLRYASRLGLNPKSVSAMAEVGLSQADERY